MNLGRIQVLQRVTAADFPLAARGLLHVAHQIAQQIAVHFAIDLAQQIAQQIAPQQMSATAVRGRVALQQLAQVLHTIGHFAHSRARGR